MESEAWHEAQDTLLPRDVEEPSERAQLVEASLRALCNAWKRPSGRLRLNTLRVLQKKQLRIPKNPQLPQSPPVNLLAQYRHPARDGRA